MFPSLADGRGHAASPLCSIDAAITNKRLLRSWRLSFTNNKCERCGVRGDGVCIDKRASILLSKSAGR